MAGQSVYNQKKTSNTSYKNTFESIKSLGSSVTPGFFDQYPKFEQPIPSEKKPTSVRHESPVFSYQEYHERSIVRKEIKELTEQIKREIEMIRKADKTLLTEVKDVEKLTLDSLPEKPGIYHIRFLELILSFLKLIKTKINESNTWLQAMMTKRKKRGSLFAHLTKKKGTQYSLSQELQLTRQTG